MWSLKSKFVKQAIALAFAVTALTACGKSSSSDTPPPVSGGGGGGSNGNNGGLPGGCVPITRAIPFVGQGVYVDSANIIGGILPSYDPGAMYASGSQFGIGGGGAGPFNRNGVDGSIQMNIQANTYGNQWQQGGVGTPLDHATVTGILTISQATIQDIVYQVAIGRISIPNLGQNFWQNPNPNLICVSGMGMNLGHYNYTLHSGRTYVYFNGGNAGYGLVF